MRMTVSFVGRNLWMIYCKAPFDPEAVASTGLNYQGIDYFMMPSMRSPILFHPINRAVFLRFNTYYSSKDIAVFKHGNILSL